MKNLLYLGNKLSSHGKTATTIETLGLLFESENYIVKTASSKKNKIYRLFDMLWHIFKFRKSTDYLLIDTYSTLNFWFAFFASQFTRILKINYIPILHGGNLPNRLYKNPKLCNLIFKNAYINVAPSGYLQTTFLNHGFKNVIFIPNVIEIEKYSFLTRDFDVPKLLWVRSFADIYNPQMAIYVFDKIKEKYPNAILSMVGPDKDGSMKVCKKLAESLNLNVNFTDKLSKNDWLELSKSHNIFINTTHFDNAPVSVIEAMALGLPVISTNVGGIPFLLNDNDNALLVSKNSVSEMVFAIQTIIENPKQTKAIVNNARLLSETFDWKNVKNNWNEILK
jgi:L-malate glycosyltransferase